MVLRFSQAAIRVRTRSAVSIVFTLVVNEFEIDQVIEPVVDTGCTLVAIAAIGMAGRVFRRKRAGPVNGKHRAFVWAVFPTGITSGFTVLVGAAMIARAALPVIDSALAVGHRPKTGGTRFSRVDWKLRAISVDGVIDDRVRLSRFFSFGFLFGFLEFGGFLFRGVIGSALQAF